MTNFELIIDKKSNISIAEQIANGLSKLILNGILAPGDRLPTERELSEKLSVSRGTVKRAYMKLAQTQAIEIRMGSGSYVLKNGRILELSQKKEAAEIISATFSRLQAMGLSEMEIFNLINLHLSNQNSIRRLTLIVVSNNHEILSELEKQLSYLSSTSLFFFTLSFLTLDNIQQNTNPVQMLLNYDLIIASAIDFPAVMEIAPMFRSKTIEAEISPSTKTLVDLSSLSRDARFSVIYHTHVFRDLVCQTLLTLGFKTENIFPFLDTEYNPVHHSDNGVRVLVNHNESPVYINPAFEDRNEEFVRDGGRILYFEYRIERNSLLYIEKRIQELLDDAQEKSFSQ